MSIFGLLESVSHFFGVGGSPREGIAGRLQGLGLDVDTQCNMLLALLVGATVELSQGSCLPLVV